MSVAAFTLFAVSATVTSVFFIQFCATVFQCGCQPLWDGAARLCNIHLTHSRHCPWCASGVTGYAVVYGGMLACQAAAAFVPLRWGWGWLARLAASLAAFPVSGVILALLFGWRAEYWNH